MAPTSLFKREASSAGAIVLAVVLFFAVNILSNLTLGSARIDLTADRLFTLSSGTRALLSRIDEPVTLRRDGVAFLLFLGRDAGENDGLHGIRPRFAGCRA